MIDLKLFFSNFMKACTSDKEKKSVFIFGLNVLLPTMPDQVGSLLFEQGQSGLICFKNHQNR